MMNRNSTSAKRLPSLKAIGAGLLLAWAASGASANSSASFSVTSFAYTVTGGQISWSLPDNYQTLGTTATDGGGLAAFDSNSDSPLTGLADASISSLTPHGSASASASLGLTIAAQTSALTSLGLPVAQPNSGVSTAAQSGVFSLSAPGTVTFFTSYVMNVTAVGGNPIDEYGQAFLSLTAGSYSNLSGGTSTVEHYSFDQATGIGTFSGTLSQTVSLAGVGDTGYYQLQGNAYSYASAAAVPEPATTAMLLAGLAGMALTVRRRNRR